MNGQIQKPSILIQFNVYITRTSVLYWIFTCCCSLILTLEKFEYMLCTYDNIVRVHRYACLANFECFWDLYQYYNIFSIVFL